ncbi:MAG: DUF3549 family protein [Chromatiales bacterium]|jgi:hypothetical protein
MNKTVTLTEFLEATGASLRFYDLGRRISKISRNDFLQFEKLELVWPYPLQQQAWFGLVMLDANQKAEPVIWFLRFPLDETGKLMQAGRDYFIHRLFEAATATRTDNAATLADALKDNPHVFKPRDDKMAVFHARLAKTLKQPASRFYAHALEYFSGAQGWEQWNFVGFQGIADVSERLEEDNNTELLCNAIAELPTTPLEALLQCLENRAVPHVLAEALQQRLKQELEKDQPVVSTLAHLARSVACSQSQTHKNHMLKQLLQSRYGVQADILAAIAARVWEWLYKPTNTALYLEKLTQTPQDVFNNILADLLYMPRLREIIMAQIRHPQRPDQLALAFSNMMKQYQ